MGLGDGDEAGLRVDEEGAGEEGLGDEEVDDVVLVS